MVPILWPLLLSIPTSLVRASPQSSASLTPYITSIVPSCAQSCLQSFIASNYPVQVCTAENFNCLCINPGTSGYTLGEGALTCLYAGCDQDGTPPRVVYNLCGSIPGAQPNRHSNLVAPSVIGKAWASDPKETSTTQSTSTHSLSKVSSTSSASSKASSIRESKSSTLSSSTSKSTTASAAASSTAASAESSATPASAASSSASSTHVPSAALTKPQIAGVTVASVGAATLAFGFCFFLICYRRRRKRYNRRPSQGSFVGDKIPSSDESTPDPAVERTGDLGYGEEPQSEKRPPLRVVTPSQGDWQRWPRNSAPSPHGIGLALSRETSRQSREGPSPITPYSHRTNSQLLPDKPHYSVFPPPPSKLAKRQSRTLHPPIPLYAPEKSPPMTGPRFPSAMDTSQSNLQGIKRSLSDPFYSDQHSPVYEGYRGVPYTPWTNPSTNAPRPSLSSDHRNSMRRNSQLPPLQEAFEPQADVQPALAAVDRSRSQKNPPRKKSASSSRYTRFSNDSGTSFEDLDEDTTTPKQYLSPVTEVNSPQRRGQSSVPPLPGKSPRRLSSVVDRPRPVPRRTSRPRLGEPLQDVESRDVTQTAKWKILVSPGLQSLEQSLPSSPRTPTTVGRTPPMPSDDRLPRPWR